MGERIPETFTPKCFKTIGKTSISGKTRYAANPMGPSGATTALRGTQPSATAHGGNPSKMKGNHGFLAVPLCDVREGSEGNESRKPLPGNASKPLGKRAFLAKPATQGWLWYLVAPQ